MNFFERLLSFLDGRKAKIMAVVGLIVGYLTASGLIESQLGALILAILNVLAGGAATITDRTFGRRNSLGQRVKN